MKQLLWLSITACLLQACASSNTYYVVRHAEKAPVPAGASRMMASDPPLSAEGQDRAIALRDLLQHKNVFFIFSTDYQRTKNTAQPLSDATQVPIVLYSARMDSMDAFISRLKTIRKGNVLVVGHSNTIDDIANKLTGKTVMPGDLPETDYSNLLIIHRKGNRYHFSRARYGKP